MRGTVEDYGGLKPETAFQAFYRMLVLLTARHELALEALSILQALFVSIYGSL